MIPYAFQYKRAKSLDDALNETEKGMGDLLKP